MVHTLFFVEIILITILILDGHYWFLGDFYFPLFVLVMGIFCTLGILALRVVARIGETYEPLKNYGISALDNMEDYTFPELRDTLRILPKGKQP